MFRLLLITACLAVPVFSNSAGAPAAVCKNGLVPEHHVDGQTSQPPYSLTGPSQLGAGQKLELTLGGDSFLGFAIQGRDDKGSPIGTFKVSEAKKSQLLTCNANGDTLTHVKIDRDHPISSVKFEWSPPANYKGKVTFYATVAKDGGTFWIRKVVKAVQVQ